MPPAAGKSLRPHLSTFHVTIAPGAARYLVVRQEEMERLVLTFPEVWPTVAGSGFSRELATVIAEI